MEYEILDRVNNPTDLRELKKKELVQLSKELRHFLIDSVSIGKNFAGPSIEKTRELSNLFVVFEIGRAHV